MREEFKITNEEIQSRGVNLDDYALDGTLIPAIIQNALDIAISRVCFLNDSFYGEEDIEKDLDKEPKKVSAFKKLQFRIIYNLIFMAEDNPVDLYVDTIITHECKWGKINGFQKGLHYKNN